MNAFTDKAFKKRLKDLNESQQSIQTLSLWLIHHRKNAQTAVNIWSKELELAPSERKLVFIYLANDVVQNSKRKGPEYCTSFDEVIADAYENVASCLSEEKTLSTLERIIKIWEDRGVFRKETIGALKLSMVKGKQKQRNKAVEELNRKRKYTQDLDDIVYEVTGSPKDSDAPPETEEVIELLRKLEKSASSDVAVRERIAALPLHVSNVEHAIKSIDEKVLSADTLYKQVESAYCLVSEYNHRLEQEMADRRKLATILPNYLTLQREEVRRLQQELKTYKDKVEEAGRVKQELDTHIASLPDLTAPPGYNPALTAVTTTSTTITSSSSTTTATTTTTASTTTTTPTTTAPPPPTTTVLAESNAITNAAINNTIGPIDELIPDDLDIDAYFD